MSIQPSGGGSAQVFCAGTGEGGIAAKAGSETAFGGGSPLSDQISGVEQAAFLQISMDGLACFLPEQAHHVKFADEKLLRQFVDVEIVTQMAVDVTDNFADAIALGH